jgi:long-chain acyl-CoA synthetase
MSFPLDQARGLTFAQMLERRALEQPDRAAVRQQRDGIWHSHTWSQLRDQAASFGSGLLELGLEPGQRVGILLRPCIEGLLALLGCQGAGLVPFGIYPGTPPETAEFLVQTTDARAVVIDADQSRALGAGAKNVELVELGDGFSELLRRGTERRAARPGEWGQLVAAGRVDAASTIYFTSGTTGRPKGVLLSSENLLTAGYFDFFSDPPGLLPAPTADDRTFHEIPLASVAGPVFGIYYGLVFDCVAYIPEQTDDATAALREAAPTIYLTFPRMWELRASEAAATIDAQPAWRRAAYNAAMSIRQRTIDLQESGRAVPALLQRVDALARRLFCGPLLAQWGFADLGLVLTGGATLTPDLIRTWRRWGVVIRQIYGQTETGGLATIQTERFPAAGNAGRPSARVQIKLDEDGEILVRGDGGLFLGYLNLPQQTAEVMDPDGWLHTGDLALLDDDGNIRVIDRKSDIITLGSGEQVVGSQLETALKQSRFIRNAVVVSDGVAVFALIELDADAAAVWARRRGITASGYEALAADGQVRALVDAEVSMVNDRLPDGQATPIAATRLLPHAIDLNDPSQVTATRKVRRRQIAERHQTLIDEMSATMGAAATA